VDATDVSGGKVLEQALAEIERGSSAAWAGVDNHGGLGDAVVVDGDHSTAVGGLVNHVGSKSDNGLVISVGVAARSETDGVVGQVASVSARGGRSSGSGGSARAGGGRGLVAGGWSVGRDARGSWGNVDRGGRSGWRNVDRGRGRGWRNVLRGRSSGWRNVLRGRGGRWRDVDRGGGGARGWRNVLRSRSAQSGRWSWSAVGRWGRRGLSSRRGGRRHSSGVAVSVVVLVRLGGLGRDWVSMGIDPDSHNDWDGDSGNVGLGDPDNVTLLLVVVLVSVVGSHWDGAGAGGAKGDDSKVLHFVVVVELIPPGMFECDS